MSQASAPYNQKQLKQAIEWFVRLQAEHCKPTEQARFERWLAKHPNHTAAYAEAERIWRDFDSVTELTLPGLAEARSAKPTTWRRKSVSAGLWLLMGSLLAGGYLEYSAETVHYMTSVGERRRIKLADHSQLELNTNTQVAIRISLLKRQVILTRGEALFSVTHERLRPFTVHADTLKIRDIGTRFNVKLQTESVEVAVLDGEVELDDGYWVKHQALKAGKQVIYKPSYGLDQNKPIETEQVTAWRSGHLVFKHTPLSVVVAELERYHPVQFVLADPKLSSETLSGTFDSDDLEPFLHALETILPVRAKRNGQQIVLRRAR